MMTATRPEKRAKRVNRKAEKLARRAAELEAKAAEASAKPPRSRKALALAAAAVVAVAAAIAGGWWYYQRQQAAELDHRAATVTVENYGDLGTAVVISDGAATIGEVADAPAVAQQGLATVEGGTVTFTRPVVATSTAFLTIADTEMRLRSDPEAVVAFLADGANISISNATITSWDGTAADEVTEDGRAYVRFSDTTLDINGLTLVGLGGPERNETGFAISDGSTGTVSDLRATGGYVGLDLQGRLPLLAIDAVDVTGSSLAGVRLASVSDVTLNGVSSVESKGDGVLIEGSTSDSTLTEVDAGANQGHGVSITGAAGNVVIDQSRMFRNGGRGISVANTRGVSLTGNTVWANNGGIGFTGANAAAVVSDNSVTGNRGGGIELVSAGTAVSITANTVDHNEFGLRIADGSATVDGNEISENGVGVLLEDTSPQATFTLNDVVSNFDTGFQLAEADGVVIDGNRILRNSHAAFTVKFEASSEQFWEANEVDGGRYGVERIYQPLREDRALADLIPIPAYFFAEEGRAFADLLQEQQASGSAGQ